MGFFPDTKPPEPSPQVVHQPQWWPAAILIFLLTGIGIVLGWILKPLLTYLFTFEGRTREQITAQIAIFAAIVLIPAFFLYRIPAVRDAISLQTTHTMNYSKRGTRILFPDRSAFIVEGSRRAFRTQSYGGISYVTYAGYTKNVMEKTDPGYCHLVPRSERLGIASQDLPSNAEGFEDEVRYTFLQSATDQVWWRYAAWLIGHPDYWLKSRSDLAAITLEVEQVTSWKEFVENWDKVWSFPGGYKPFEVKALASEHAVLCF